MEQKNGRMERMMQRFDNTYTNDINHMGRPLTTQDMGDWGAEINGGGMNNMVTENQSQMWQGQNMSRPMNGATADREMMSRNNNLADSMQNNLGNEIVESPTTVQEAYYGSLRAFLTQNKGNFVVATFLIGTQGTAEFEGVLYEVGNDYMVIYQEGRDRYIVVDIYSLKYIEFYDTEKRQLCNQLLRQQGMWPVGNRANSMQWSPNDPMRQR